MRTQENEIIICFLSTVGKLSWWNGKSEPRSPLALCTLAWPLKKNAGKVSLDRIFPLVVAKVLYWLCCSETSSLNQTAAFTPVSVTISRFPQKRIFIYSLPDSASPHNYCLQFPSWCIYEYNNIGFVAGQALILGKGQLEVRAKVGGKHLKSETCSSLVCEFFCDCVGKWARARFGPEDCNC